MGHGLCHRTAAVNARTRRRKRKRLCCVLPCNVRRRGQRRHLCIQGEVWHLCKVMQTAAHKLENNSSQNHAGSKVDNSKHMCRCSRRPARQAGGCCGTYECEPDCNSEHRASSAEHEEHEEHDEHGDICVLHQFWCGIHSTSLPFPFSQTINNARFFLNKIPIQIPSQCFLFTITRKAAENDQKQPHTIISAASSSSARRRTAPSSARARLLAVDALSISFHLQARPVTHTRTEGRAQKSSR